MFLGRCKSCRWWDKEHVSVSFIPESDTKPNPGFCRKRRPVPAKHATHFFGIQPVMDADEYCGEYKSKSNE